MQDCDEFATGQYQDVEGQGECKCCSQGSWNADQGSVSCVSCGRGTAQNRTCQTICLNCENDFEAPDSGMFVCAACRPGEHTNPSLGFERCRSCISNQYAQLSLSTGKFVDCRECPDHSFCDGSSIVLASEGYWLGRAGDGSLISYKCPLGFCIGSSQCGAGRSRAENNPLCGRCEGSNCWRMMRNEM